MASAKTRPAHAHSSEVDQYIALCEPFARPVLEHLRSVVHAVTPDIVEEMKWSRPFFVYQGIILANIAGFKQHCSFGVWSENALPLMKQGVERRGQGMGSFGKLTSIHDLPSDGDLTALLTEAIRKIDSGERTSSMPRARKATRPTPEVPAALAAALAKNKRAAQSFAQLSPSCQREYIDWIAEAKRDETRDKRIATTLEWVADGKSLHWKYEKRG